MRSRTAASGSSRFRVTMLARCSGPGMTWLRRCSKTDAEDLARFALGRFPGRDRSPARSRCRCACCAGSPAPRLVAGGDHAVGDLALEHVGGGHVDHVRQRGEIAEGAQPVRAAGARVRGGQRRQLEIVDERGAPDLLAHGHGHRRAGRADVLERCRRRQLQRRAQLAHELPGVERVEQVDVAGRTRQHAQRQLAGAGEDAGRGLVGIASITQLELVHSRPHGTAAWGAARPMGGLIRRCGRGRSIRCRGGVKANTLGPPTRA